MERRLKSEGTFTQMCQSSVYEFKMSAVWGILKLHFQYPPLKEKCNESGWKIAYISIHSTVQCTYVIPLKQPIFHIYLTLEQNGKKLGRTQPI